MPSKKQLLISYVIFPCYYLDLFSAAIVHLSINIWKHVNCQLKYLSKATFIAQSEGLDGPIFWALHLYHVLNNTSRNGNLYTFLLYIFSPIFLIYQPLRFVCVCCFQLIRCLSMEWPCVFLVCLRNSRMMELQLMPCGPKQVWLYETTHACVFLI